MPFVASREIVAVYRLTVPLPVTVTVAMVTLRVGLELSDCPPFVDSWIRRAAEDPGLWLGRYECIDHARFHFATGYEVECPSLLETVFEKLVDEGRAVVVAGRHCELRQLQLPPPPEPRPLDTFYEWRFSDAHEGAAEHCIMARGMWPKNFISSSYL